MKYFACFFFIYSYLLSKNSSIECSQLLNDVPDYSKIIKESDLTIDEIEQLLNIDSPNPKGVKLYTDDSIQKK